MRLGVSRREVREHAARWWSCGQLKSSSGNVATVMKSLRWLGEDRSPLTFDSGSLGSTQHWTPLGSFKHTHTHASARTHILTHTRARTHISSASHTHTSVSYMLAQSDIPCKSAFINVTFVSQTKKQTSKLS